MRRLAHFVLLAVVHLFATIFSLWLNLWLLFRMLNSHPAPPVLDRAAEAVSWILGFPVLVAASLAGVNLFDPVNLYGIAALNSMVWVAAGVLARRAWTRRCDRAWASGA